MPYDEDGLVTLPSLKELTYQAEALKSEARKFTAEEYPRAACQVAKLLLCIAAHISEQLWKIRMAAQRKGSDLTRAVSLAALIRESYSYIRFLRATIAHRAPPAIQKALVDLADRHVSQDNDRFVCIVRPQWRYNFTYRSISSLLEELTLDLLDPAEEIQAANPTEFITRLWEKERAKAPDETERKTWDDAPPLRVAILSFPGLDTDNALSYALLGHELGHHIDYSHEPRLSTIIATKVAIHREEVEVSLGGAKSAEEVEDKWQVLSDLVETAVQELLADQLATRMLGLSFFLAQSEFLKTATTDWPGPSLDVDSGYPGIAFRLNLIFDELNRTEEGWSPEQFFRAASRGPTGSVAKPLLSYLARWRDTLRAARTSWWNPTGPELLAVNAIKKAVPLVRAAARKAIPSRRRARLEPTFFQRIRLLENRLPPLTKQTTKSDFPEILSSACAYQLVLGADRELKQGDPAKACAERQKTSRLVMKAIELLALDDHPGPADIGVRPRQIRRAKPRTLGPPSVMSGQDILARAALPVGDPRQLAVVPWKPALVQGASLDVRLGNWFAVARRIRLSQVDLDSPKARELLLKGAGRQEEYVPLGEPFVVHPGDFVLGTTLEFFYLPHDVMAFVEGKSMIGRAGLLVATATQVAPTFRGVVVLELANAGTVPLLVHPGMPIAQLVFHRLAHGVSKRFEYSGPSECQIRP